CSKGEGRVKVSFSGHAMSDAPHLPPTQGSGAAGNPLPLGKGRGGLTSSRDLRCPSDAAPGACHVTKIAILLWIFAVAIRLTLIDQPYVDDWSWRQSDVAAIARNFFEHGFRFGYPQIDWAGSSAGYVGTEFPILPFLAAICYKFSGIHE